MAALLPLALTACEPQASSLEEPAERDLTYSLIETEALDETLVRFQVEVEGAREDADVLAFADCVVAGHGKTEGFDYAQHVRTTLNVTRGMGTGDAVYLLSKTVPDGPIHIELPKTADACLEKGIPLL